MPPCDHRPGKSALPRATTSRKGAGPAAVVRLSRRGRHKSMAAPTKSTCVRKMRGSPARRSNASIRSRLGERLSVFTEHDQAVLAWAEAPFASPTALSRMRFTERAPAFWREGIGRPHSHDDRDPCPGTGLPSDFKRYREAIGIRESDRSGRKGRRRRWLVPYYKGSILNWLFSIPLLCLDGPMML
jgi:hypothetical protein